MCQAFRAAARGLDRNGSKALEAQVLYELRSRTDSCRQAAYLVCVSCVSLVQLLVVRGPSESRDPSKPTMTGRKRAQPEPDLSEEAE